MIARFIAWLKAFFGNTPITPAPGTGGGSSQPGPDEQGKPGSTIHQT